MKRIFFLIILLCFSHVAFSQYFTTGSDPSNIKWRQINEKDFQVIYPEDYEVQAKRFAAMLKQTYNLGYQSLGTAPKKISIVLHSHTVNSNGMVATAPNRMEIYPTPHQDMYAQEWLSQLAVHEYRHVVQISKIQQELPFIIKFLFGEQGTALVMGAYLPFWFMEGDAVVTETALTESGRGRNPSFLMENKAQLLEQGAASYDKITMGSYKDYIPNRYAFGWWFTGGVRAKYGADVWEKVLHNIAKRPYYISPMNKVMKSITGQTKEKIYTQLWTEYEKEWQAEIDSLKLTPYEKYKLSDLNSYTNYRYIDHLGDGSVVAVRKSRGDITRIVRLSDSREEILYTPGSIVTGSFSAQGNLLIWNESRPNIRWTHADHTKTIIYNTETREKRVFSSEDNLSSPAVSFSGNKFLAVAASQQGKYEIQIFNTTNGRLVKKIQLPHNDYIISPVWDASGDKIYFIGLGVGGKYIASFNLKDNQIQYLTDIVHYDMRNLSYGQNSLIFTSAKSGIDNIYELNLPSNSIHQLTEAKFGADYGSKVDNHLDYANYTSDGYKLVKAVNNELAYKQVGNAKQKVVSNALADCLANQEKSLVDFSKLDTTRMKSKPYRKFPHAINIHSWAPAATDIENYSVTLPGISFQSQNKLGTALTDFGYLYNLSEDRGKAYLNYQYIGWFPTIKLRASYGGRNLKYAISDDDLRSEYTSAQWNELKLSSSIGFPLKFNTGKYSQSIQPSISYSLSKAFNPSESSPIICNNNALTYQLYLSNVLRKSELDLQNKWGQVLQFNFVNSFKNLDDFGRQFSVASDFYFPGLFHYDGFKLFSGYQWRDKERLNMFNDFIPIARGYNSINTKELATIRVNYAFPLCYPDWSMGKLFYFQRVRANAFFDYSRYNSEVLAESFPTQTIKISDNLKSYGLEVYTDGYFLRLPTPITMGLRTMYLPNMHSFKFEFILSVDAYGI